MIQAVIMAAGKSTRTYPLTLTRPKPLLPILNRPLISHTLEQVAGLVDEIVIVVGYMEGALRDAIGARFKGTPVRYVTQKEQKGTGSALLAAKDVLKDRFLVLNGDDLYGTQDMKTLLDYRFAILAKRVKDPSKFGVLETSGTCVKRIIEKPKDPPTDLTSIGMYMLDTSVLDYDLNISERGEYEITDLISMCAERHEVFYHIAEEEWIPVGYPWQVLEANEKLMGTVVDDREGAIIDEGATIKGTISVGADTHIKAGAYIEGPVVIGEGCVIGPNCYVRSNTVIGDGCKVGNAVEIKNSVLFNDVRVGHLSYVGDSVLGEGVNLGAGTMVANLRHDGENVRSAVKGKLVDTGRRKLGVILADGVKTGINTTLYPGRKLWPGVTTRPGEVIEKDR